MSTSRGARRAVSALNAIGKQLSKQPSLNLLAHARPVPACVAVPSRRQFHSSNVSRATITYSPPQAHIGQPAPGFTAPAVVDGEFVEVKLSDYKGKWTVLLFYPKDFTYVCPTELIAFSDRHKEFETINAQVLGISTDTEESHLAWTRLHRKKGGLGHMSIPLIADTTKTISADYGVLIEKIGIALRGLFIINPDGVLEQVTINNLGIGRSVDEALRLLQAHQFVAEHGEVCPADWKPGAPSMKGDAEGSQEYFASVATDVGEEADPLAVPKRITVIKSVNDYKEFIMKPKAVVDFVAPWCGKCRQIQPYVNQLSEEFKDVSFAKFDTTEDAVGDLAMELGIKALPAFHFFKEGKPVATPVTGYKKKLLKETIESL